ncbi:Gfo/Idh/MocA family protein [Enterobacter cancerogenus]|uniref:Gfo/Idh/MocA family protein n=1 Tax=Enterobacter cancerogenus TaxID=69218 RepID=UPI000536B6F8|nr:Gfo/Idh/MocA family oxidoreductase [Enterobacter cancerogenus]KGT88704.1 dehydrogenase [Enterobacter cancerogenus]
MKIGLAVIGTGYFSQFQCKAWGRIAEVELKAVCSLDADVAQQYAEDYKFSRFYTDVDKLVAECQPDLIDIVTPPATHLELIKKGAAAGINMICQKPFCRNREEAEEAIRIAADANIHLIIHENFRFQPWYHQIKSILDAGTLGSIYQAQFNLRPGDGRGEDAYLSRQPYFRQMKQFLIHETAIHFIDVFRFLFGDITSVWSSLRRLNPVIAGEDAALVVMHNAEGLQMVFDGNRLSGHAATDSRRTMGEMLIEGSKACLSLDGDGRIRLRFQDSAEWQEHTYEWRNIDFGGDCVYLTQQAALRGLTQSSPIVNSAQDYLKNIKVEEAIYLSDEQKRQIVL